ncbi:hypothetical protein P9C27_10485 [Bacillus vallismortis]|uniref:hypothetical protein n=1 Tax=Bacillus vallismortis TaxID=72361 RepID=UPI002DB65463|nr:hypothetical protein [Bacillus vallismortis]MEC1268960.1 hypothetical protein [Bacillus vallismortis]MEC1650113.1 hypothetical protein [Bacillus vallismortis]
MIKEMHSYYCEDCEEWTHIEVLKYPNGVHCAHCGTEGVSISSEDFKKLEWASEQN